MGFDSQIHHRRSIRVTDFDYSTPGNYFFTSVAYRRECLFGTIENGKMHTNPLGNIVQEMWENLPHHYLNIELGTFCVMPNHVHGIIIINDVEMGFPDVGVDVGAGLRPAPTSPTNKKHPLSEIIRAFKSFSAREINAIRGTSGIPVWQRNYYEHIIRNDDDLNRIHLYIESNPMNWTNDEEFLS